MYPNGLIQYTAGNNAIYQFVYIGNQENSNAIGFSLVDAYQQLTNQQQINMLNLQVTIQGMNDAYKVMNDAITCWNGCVPVWK